MAQYSTGPFMKMSPSGAPGLLVVVGVVLGTVALFTPPEYHPLLFALTVPILIVILAVGLHSAYRTGPVESSPHLFPVAGREDADKNPAPESGSPRPFPSALRELGFTVIALLITVGFFLILASSDERTNLFSRLGPFSVILLALLLGVVLSFGAIRLRRSWRSRGRGSGTSMRL